MIYQRMRGNADEGTSNLICKFCNLSIYNNSFFYKISPLFFVTNTKDNIFLENNKN